MKPTKAELEAALEIAISYTSLVASGVGNMPILKQRAISDTAIIENTLRKIKETQ